MRQVHCPQEENISRAIRSGDWPPALLTHAAECVACRGALRTAQWMGALSNEPNTAPQTPLPNATLIWRRAQIDRSHESRAASVRGTLEWAHVAFAAAASFGLATWVTLNWYEIQAVAAGFLLADSPRLAAYGLASLAPATLTLASLALGYPAFVGD